MARTTLPSKTHPLTGEPIVPVYVDRHGRARWPIMGGAPDDPPPADPPASGPPADPPADPPAAPRFPANTPWQEMKPAEQAAYWQTQSRKHEDRVKAFGGLTPEQLAELRDKAGKHDALEDELASDKEKAVKDAKNTAKSELDAHYRPRLVRAEFKAAASGRISADQLSTILEPLDLSRFLNDSGDVDTDKVQKYVDGIAPAKGTPSSAGPTVFGLPSRQPQSPTPGEQGRAQAEKRFGTKQTSST